MQLNPDNPDVYIFMKEWKPESQQLLPHGVSFAKFKDRIDHTVYKYLRVAKDPSLPIWIERNMTQAEAVKRRKTFQDLALRPGVIVIFQRQSPGLDEEEWTNRIVENCGFPDLKSYLRMHALDAAFPTRTNETATYTLDYFGQEYYQGSLKCHEAHGEGTMIKYSGDTYRGWFHMGKRHGSGRMSYTNGDAYTGSWARDQHSGAGRYVDAATQNVYEGGWKDGRRYGEGITHWKRAEEGEKVCRVCWEELADAALNDCGHVVACLNCARRVENCPVCRRKVASALKLWFVS
jgi:hypothetical protein